MLKNRYSISGVSKEREKMVLISFHVPRSYVEVIDELVRLGLYPSRSEAIRAALRELLSKYKLDGV
jgi:antitoxin ParD1/3/4